MENQEILKADAERLIPTLALGLPLMPMLGETNNLDASASAHTI